MAFENADKMEKGAFFRDTDLLNQTEVYSWLRVCAHKSTDIFHGARTPSSVISSLRGFTPVDGVMLCKARLGCPGDLLRCVRISVCLLKLTFLVQPSLRDIE